MRREDPRAEVEVIVGYKPRSNVQSLLYDAVEDRIARNAVFDRAARSAVEQPAVPSFQNSVARRTRAGQHRVERLHEQIDHLINFSPRDVVGRRYEDMVAAVAVDRA